MNKFLFIFLLFGALPLMAQDQPNFVWLISEDNSKHYLKLFDSDGIATPNIEKLAANGLVFTRAFSNAPVCSVARTTLITGCYGPRIGTQYHRKSQVVPMPQGLKMFPTYLREAGYYTANNRKKDYNAEEGDGVWDESSGKAHWRKRKTGQPFFYKESFAGSHESRLHFKAAHMDTAQTTIAPKDVFVSPRHPDTKTFRFTNAYYRERMRVVDDNLVAKIVKQLEEDGLLESTFIFYFGDHGGVLPGSKGYVYETGVHVPLVVRIPEKFKHLVKLKAGKSSDAFVSFIDFGPTLLHLAGIKVPTAMDGSPFLGPDIKKGQLKQRKSTYSYADRFDEKYDLVRTVREGRFKYMRSYQPFNPDGLHNFYRYRMLAYAEWRQLYQDNKLNAVQQQFFNSRAPEALYDIANDPYETKNLASNPKYQKKLMNLRTKLQSWVKGMPDLSFYPEPELRKEAFLGPVTFGQSHQKAISDLVDIADLSLLPFEQAKAGIQKALDASDPWKRYWGLIVCSTFDKKAAVFYAKAKALQKDENLLVRTRAAEFLALTGQEDPKEVIRGALQQTQDDIEAALILNTVVLLMDSPAQYRFDLKNELLGETVLKQDLVQRRMEYIIGRQQ